METPPALPSRKPPLGASFYVFLLTPLVLMAVSVCCLHRSGNFVNGVLGAMGLATLVSSIVLSIRLGRRLSKPGGSPAILSVLLFIGLQLFYGICIFIGCTAAVTLG